MSKGGGSMGEGDQEFGMVGKINKILAENPGMSYNDAVNRAFNQGGKSQESNWGKQGLVGAEGGASTPAEQRQRDETTGPVAQEPPPGDQQ